jgi:hypothetical protein
MEIEAIKIDEELTMLKVTGPLDPKHPVMVRARELAISTGSAAFIASFDAVVAEGHL